MLSKNTKIYVAGHRGLVGSAIWNNLIARGYTNLVGRTHAELDLKDPVAVRAFFDAEQPEAVVLAAAHVGGIWANNIYRADFIYDNLQIQQNVIGESFRHGVDKLLFLGSSCIYPKEATQPIRESELLTNTLEYTNESYAIAKIAGLKLCESFNIQYGTNYIAVMPTNLYGPNDNFHLENSHVLPAMIRKIYLAGAMMAGNWEAVRCDLRARPVSGEAGEGSQEEIQTLLSGFGICPGRVALWGTGEPRREFLWSEDMADASVHILLNTNFSDLYSPDQSEVRNCHVNIGTGEDITIYELARLIAQALDYQGTIEWDSTKPNGTMRKLSSVDKLHSLGWRHSVEIGEGVARLCRWYLGSIGSVSDQ